MQHRMAPRPRRRGLVPLAALGAVLALVLAIGGSAYGTGDTGKVDSPEKALAALDKAQKQLDAVREYLKKQRTTPPTTTPAPTTTVPPTIVVPPPSGDLTSAAAQRGWGAPAAGDEFNTGAVPDTNWSRYNGPGHAGNGRRVPGAFSIANGLLQVHGDANGNTGGMRYKSGQYQGRWEARVRNSGGDRNYHPVLILWPDAEDFPVGGEVDYMEIGDRQKVDFFLHYSAANSQTHGSKAIDTTQWHNYAVEWNASCVTGWVDNAQFFQDCNTGHLPPRAMHMTIQLDGFHGSSGYIPTDLFVDWIRQYKL